jgi:hypothetical protein
MVTVILGKEQSCGEGCKKWITGVIWKQEVAMRT